MFVYALTTIRLLDIKLTIEVAITRDFSSNRAPYDRLQPSSAAKQQRNHHCVPVLMANGETTGTLVNLCHRVMSAVLCHFDLCDLKL